MTTKAERQSIGRRSKARSKSHERDWAHALGVPRNRDTGDRLADLFLDGFDVEVKGRLGMVELVALMDEAVAKARAGQTPVLGLTLRAGPGKRLRHLVVMERKDWADWNVGLYPNAGE